MAEISDKTKGNAEEYCISYDFVGFKESVVEHKQ